jgi:adenosylcobinamide-GDP ribazoletransferase
MQRLHQTRLAMRMLTRLPMGRLPEPAPSLGASAWAFPLVGFVTGGLTWATFHGAAAMGASPHVAAIVALAALAWMTGALHEDGLADLADGLGGGRDRDHCLEIMRDSRIGSYGVVALIFTLGLKITALSDLDAQASFWALVFLGVTSRGMMLAVLVFLPPARRDGLGQKASGVAQSALLPGLAITALCTVFLGVQAIVMLTTMTLATGGLVWLAWRRLRGQTGDVLGAVQIISETVGLAALAVFWGS